MEIQIGKGQGITQAIKAQLEGNGQSIRNDINASIWGDVMTQLQSAQANGAEIFKGNDNVNDAIANKNNKSNFVVQQGKVEIEDSVWNKIVNLLTGQADRAELNKVAESAKPDKVPGQELPQTQNLAAAPKEKKPYEKALQILEDSGLAQKIREGAAELEQQKAERDAAATHEMQGWFGDDFYAKLDEKDAQKAERAEKAKEAAKQPEKLSVPTPPELESLAQVNIPPNKNVPLQRRIMESFAEHGLFAKFNEIQAELAQQKADRDAAATHEMQNWFGEDFYAKLNAKDAQKAEQQEKEINQLKEWFGDDFYAKINAKDAQKANQENLQPDVAQAKPNETMFDELSKNRNAQKEELAKQEAPKEPPQDEELFDA